ncbi:lipoprotein [Colwellia psychrerythraea]|uniref:Lipoprotein n=1 Tax=Colwellia psychrerythraea TaxID=28229 RepID=A0A099KTD3_COLPS|nr:lipoprotein [Colwellia psychrerythraea]KGJ93801.1 lipoprotein [Colwellia psychrerythraea]
MKYIFALACVLLLSSCVYYGVQRDFGGDSSAPCTKGSSKDNKKCNAEIKALNNELKNTHNH